MRWLLALMGFGLAACGGETSSPSRRPNLLLVLTDDQRYDTLSCNGSEVVETPHIDRLAAEGARFTSAYVTTSLCCPARASLYTGLYAHGHGVRNNEDPVDFLREHPGFPALLQASGYDTGFFGKWHIHNPRSMPQPGFDKWVSFHGQGQYEDEFFNIDGEQRQIEGFNTDNLFDLAIEWLSAERDAPFLCIVSLKNLHRPYVLPRRHMGVLANAEFLEPESFHDDPANYPAYIQRVRGTLRNRFFDDGGTHAENVRGYNAMVLSVDDNVGRLYGALGELGVLDSTALALTSDGGFMWGEHGMYRKRTAYEPSIRVPLILRYPPEIAPGRELDALSLGVDLMPTFLELAGVDPPPVQHGRSLRALWQEGDAAWREDFLYTDGWGKFVDGPQELALVTERYKLVRYRRDQVEDALFDRAADPDERTNLIDDPSLADTVGGLRERLAAAVGEVGAPESWLEAVEVGER